MFRKRKKFTCVLLCLLMLLVTVLPNAAMTLDINGQTLNHYVEKGVTYVPVRFFMELYDGYNVIWDADNGLCYVVGNGLDMTVYPGKNYVVANDRSLVREGATRTFDDRLYAPITSLAAAVGTKAVWDKNTNHVSVKGGGTAIEGASSFYNSDDLYWLSRIIEAESKGESFLGKVAVGNVVLNRVSSSLFPSTVEGVIFDDKFGIQFTPAANGTIYNTPSDESVLAAKGCLEGFSISNTAMYFLNPRIATSSWITANRPFEFSIGNHDFYS